MTVTEGTPHAAATLALLPRCPELVPVVALAGVWELPPSAPTGFQALARAIVAQQLAGRAATTIFGRVGDRLGGAWTPDAVLAADPAELRGAGLSGAKLAALTDLATRAADGRLDLEGLAGRPDEEVVEALVQVRGVGRWTAEMYLLFHLGRLDVWPVGDLGVRRGYARLHGLPGDPSPQELGPAGDRYAPYRSVAAWYCWRAAELPTTTPWPRPRWWEAPHPGRLAPSAPHRREILRRHADAVAAGATTYADPATGATVFTATFLASRPCCEQGCRHCPWVA